jgi:hypothetical protein
MMVVVVMLMTPVTMTLCLPVSLVYFEITVHYSSHFSLLAVLIERFHDFITSLQSTAITVGLLQCKTRPFPYHHYLTLCRSFFQLEWRC